MNLRKKKNKFVLIFFICLFFLIPFLIPLTKSIPPQNRLVKIHSSSEEHHTDQWLNNPSFENPNESWFCTTQGDISDVNGSLVDGKADFNIMGDQHTFSLIADPPLALD